MPHKRIGQFLAIYCSGLALLLAYKYGRGLSDYVIPGPGELAVTARAIFRPYVLETVDTLLIAILGHILAIGIAAVVAMIGRLHNWGGSLIKVAAYNIQAYPIVAVAPIIFILLGDGMLSRLLIGAMICYFPLLLSFLGILSEPVAEVEHFYAATGRRTWRLEVKVRAFENLHKIMTVVIGTATLAVVGTIIAEFIAADAGIGYAIRTALYQSDMARILISLFIIGLFSFSYIALLEIIGRKIAKRLTGCG